MKESYSVENIELFGELVSQKITTKQQAIQFLTRNQRHSEAEYIARLSDREWNLGLFEGTVLDFHRELGLEDEAG